MVVSERAALFCGQFRIHRVPDDHRLAEPVGSCGDESCVCCHALIFVPLLDLERPSRLWSDITSAPNEFVKPVARFEMRFLLGTAGLAEQA